MCEIYTQIDNTTMVIDYISSGSSIHAEMVLFGTPINVNVVCNNKISVYELHQKQFFSTIQEYFEFNDFLLGKLSKRQEGADNLLALDYCKNKPEITIGKRVETGEKAVRLQRSVIKLKNVIMYYVLRNREERKVPKLKDIIEQAKTLAAAQNEAMRRRRENMNLDNLKSDSQYMDENQAQQIMQTSEKIKSMLMENDTQLRVLRQKILDNLIRRKDI